MTQYISLTYEWAQQQAKDANCVIEHADDHTLQIDCDSTSAYCTFQEQYDRMLALGLLVPAYDLADPFDDACTVKRSKSGNRHITVKLAVPLPVEQRILLQALLGSDRTREALSLARVRAGNPHPVLLFRPAFLVEDVDGAPYPDSEQAWTSSPKP